MVAPGKDLPRQEAQALDSGEIFGGEGAHTGTDFDGENKRERLNFLGVLKRV